MTVDEAKALVKNRLSEKRYKHTINVKKMAVKLAKRYGADEEKAALAALLHDSAKELPKAEILQVFADNAIIAKKPPSACAGVAWVRGLDFVPDTVGCDGPGNFICH